MRKLVFTLPFTISKVVTGTGALLLAGQALAAALFTLEGTTPDVVQEGKADLRLSVLEWSGDEQRQRVIKGFTSLKEDSDADAFAELLNDQETRGFLFTGEVSGYAVKYAKENLDGSMSLLITPGLKTRNKYLWKTPPPENAPGFTMLELKWNKDAAELFTSLDEEIVATDDGLRLNKGEHKVFGTLEDATPYYLKQGN